MPKRVHNPVPLPIAYSRVIRCLITNVTRHGVCGRELGTLAHAIWPDATFRSQGAAGAASRILKRMEKAGMVEGYLDSWGVKMYMLRTDWREKAKAAGVAVAI